ncbi:MAG TPA: excinuclease ABC subunit UvrC [Oligoflexia bacterium]|nr:excinuclease ABC subunit UvrC [Oligoflexia bacterium]HMP26572.1 excinuclease ABC subunit UvrC [Oligoflexia bacterium]
MSKNIETLKAIARLLPRQPGVYIFRDKVGEALYVGKAKDLKARVRQYFNQTDQRAQIDLLLTKAACLEHILAPGEYEAILIERDLIGKLKPRYNIKLRDDKEFFRIRLDSDAEWPRLELVRKPRFGDLAEYFGPYSNGAEIRRLFDVIRRTVPLRSCSDTILYNRQRPCLEYEMGYCAAPCCLSVNRAEYGRWVNLARDILKGKVSAVVAELEKEMERAAAATRFEEAAVLRDRIEALRGYDQAGAKVIAEDSSQDVFGWKREGSLAALYQIKARGGRFVESRAFYFDDLGVSDEAALEGALQETYFNEQELPNEILLPFNLQNVNFLKIYFAKHCQQINPQIIAPKRGLKFRLLKLAQLNAERAFETHFKSSERFVEVAKKMAVSFQLAQMPRRVECIDISHLQGLETVGAAVVFFDGEPLTSLYRKYKISADGSADDFAGIYEVVSRRLASAKKSGDLSDLIVIDGGAGQLRSALKARDELGLKIDIIALAKARVIPSKSSKSIDSKPERVFLEGSDKSVSLDPSSKITHFLSRLRDEAHRFVLSFHRFRRNKRNRF